MGTGGFIIPSLKALADSRHEIVSVCTMPLRTGRTGKKAGIPPVRAVVADLGLPMMEPENVNIPEVIEAMLRPLAFDLIFICDYGKILSRDVVSLARWGGINLHGSLLPKYRGAAPINRAVLAGEKELGVSVIHIMPEVDAGPVIATDSYFPEERHTAVEIEQYLAELGVPLVLAALDNIENGTVTSLEQNAALACKAPKLAKEDGRINWQKTNTEIINHYRAVQPWPKAFCDWRKQNGAETDSPVRLILGPFERAEEESTAPGAEPGTVLLAEKNQLIIKTGDGALRVLEVQPAGKKQMTAEAFLRGYKIRQGDFLSNH